MTAVTQDADTGEVLMVAYMNRSAWEQTLASGQACYYSTSRNKLWVKGETSGNVQDVKEIRVDCDGDAVLLKVHQRGAAACHEGYKSCFFRKIDPKTGKIDVVGHRLSFAHNRFQIHSRDGQRLYAGTVRIDASAKPAAIDFEHLEGELKGRAWRGIYVLSGDRLTICDNSGNLDRDRPTAFEAKAGSGHVLITFQRAKS